MFPLFFRNKNAICGRSWGIRLTLLFFTVVCHSVMLLIESMTVGTFSGRNKTVLYCI